VGQPAKAEVALAEGWQHISQQAAEFDEAAVRHSYLHHVEEHRTLQELMTSHLLKDSSL
jgi:hypothetical protein